MKLDFSKFKKIESNDKEVTMMHPSGHRIRISKSGLSPEAAKTIDDIPIHLAKGGRYGKWAQKFDPNIKQKGYKLPPGRGVGNEPAGVSKVSEPAKPKGNPMYTEPSDIGTKQPAPTGRYGLPKLDIKPVSQWNVSGPAQKPMYPPCINPSCKSYGHSHPNCRCYGGNEYAAERFAEGGQVGKYYCDNNRPHFKSCELYADGGQVQTQPPPQPSPIQQAQSSMRQAFHFDRGGGVPAVQLSAQDIDPNAPVSIDDSNMPKTPQDQSPDDFANNAMSNAATPGVAQAVGDLSQVQGSQDQGNEMPTQTVSEAAPQENAFRSIK